MLGLPYVLADGDVSKDSMSKLEERDELDGGASADKEEEQTDSDDERHRQRVNSMSYESSMVH